MHKKLAIALTTLFWPAQGPRAATPNPHVFVLGVGTAITFDTDLFNVPEDVSAAPDAAINVGYTFGSRSNWAAGVHYYGSFKVIRDYPFVDYDGNPVREDINFDAGNLGIKVQHYFMRERLQPYNYLSVNYAFGSARGSSFGEALYAGFSFGGGIGMMLVLTPRVGLGLEAIASTGTAYWDQFPFTNSTSRKINPSMIGLVVNFNYLWGKNK